MRGDPFHSHFVNLGHGVVVTVLSETESAPRSSTWRHWETHTPSQVQLRDRRMRYTLELTQGLQRVRNDPPPEKVAV